MKLSSDELRKLLRIVDAIYEGKPAPRAKGQVGQFLRGCEHGRLDVQHVLAKEGLATHAAGWVSGDGVGEIIATPLRDLEAAVPSDIYGPVERAPVMCEQLGMVAELTLWTSARSANRARTLLTRGGATSISLKGGYRWFAPARVTPGDSTVEMAIPQQGWSGSRFLKAVAEDVGRPPHALEYVHDYRIGQPGLKVFRVMAGRPEGTTIEVFAAGAVGSRIVQLVPPEESEIRDVLDAAPLALIFAYREPWDQTWQVIDAKAATDTDCFDHLLSWADFRNEISGQPRITHPDVAALRLSLAKAGVTVEDDVGLGGASLNRLLLAPAARLLRWFRFRA